MGLLSPADLCAKWEIARRFYFSPSFFPLQERVKTKARRPASVRSKGHSFFKILTLESINHFWVFGLLSLCVFLNPNKFYLINRHDFFAVVTDNLPIIKAIDEVGFAHHGPAILMVEQVFKTIRLLINFKILFLF